MSSTAELAREAFFQSLEELYSALQMALPTVEGNPCGRCRECCTGRGLTRHNVTPLELDYIAARGGHERLSEFRRFLERDGQVELCPYFDEERWGCGIYAHRPYSCRVFGHYRSQSTALPEVCVFRGQEKIFQVRQYFEAVPLAAELRELVRAYWPHQQEHFTTPSAPGDAPSPSGLEAEGDALDQALQLMSRGELQRALSVFEESELPSTPFVLYCLSLAFEGLERHGDAVVALQVASAEAPECPPLWFRLACNLHACGRQEESEAAFRRTLELAPEHALAHGLLGGQLLTAGRLPEALASLRAALALAPERESFRRLLQQAEAAT